LALFCYIIVHKLLGAVGIFEAQMGAMAIKVSETLTGFVVESAALTEH
jgi:energy-converting hydrogenase Eha subunit A